MNKTLILVFLLSLFLVCNVVAQSNQTISNGALTNAVNFAGGCSYTWINDNAAIGLPASGSGNINSFIAKNTTNSPVTATIRATPTVSGFAYIANLESSSVSVISVAENKVVATIRVESKPYGVAVNPNGTKVYVTHGMSMSVISTATNTVVKKIPFAGLSYGVCVSEDGSTIYVANNGTNSVYIIDAATDMVTNIVPAGKGPYGVAVSPDKSRVYAVNYIADQTKPTTVTVINTLTSSIVTQIGVGIMAAEGIIVNKDGSRVYVTNQVPNSVSVINTATNTVIDNITGLYQPRGIVFSPDHSKIYTKNQLNNQLLVTDLATNTTTVAGQAGRGSVGIDLTADGVLAYVTNYFDNTVSVINTLTHATISTIPVETLPMSLGKFISSGIGCSPVTFTITVNPGPSLVTGSITGNISTCAGTPSVNTQQFQVSGTYLTGAVTATAPAGFEVSTLSNSGFANSVTLNPVNGSVTGAIIYIRAGSAATVATSTGDVVLSTSGLANKTIPVSAVVNLSPTIDRLPGLSVKAGTIVNSIAFTGTASQYKWTNSDPSIGLPTSGTGGISAFTAISTSNQPIVATITVTPVNNNGCDGAPAVFTITVVNDPVLTLAAVTGNIAGCFGSVSSSRQQFEVSGKYLKGNVNITAPSGFKISASPDDGFADNVSLVPVNGLLTNAVVYVRSSNTAAVGINSGNVLVASAGLNDQTVKVTSIVNVVPIVNALSNQRVKAKTSTFAITFTGTADQYKWTNTTPGIGLASNGTGNINAFIAVNMADKLVTATINVVPVNASGCEGAPVIFNIVVDPLQRPVIIAPNAFTPNGDGVNETWVIQNISEYPKATVKVFNRLGNVVFSSQGYPQPWNGKSGDSSLPTGTYYYVIDTNEDKVISGYLSLIR